LACDERFPGGGNGFFQNLLKDVEEIASPVVSSPRVDRVIISRTGSTSEYTVVILIGVYKRVRRLW
jgi:hypothetical protein